MRIRALLIAFSLMPVAAQAQLRRPDSTGLALAIARAIRLPIEKNGAARSTIVTTRTITPLSRIWNARVAASLKFLDSTLVTRKPTSEALRINVVSLDIFGLDSANANVAMSRCFADRFVGNSADYVFKRRGEQWVMLREQKGFAARGPCPKK
jgi:hypothetical protein